MMTCKCHARGGTRARLARRNFDVHGVRISRGRLTECLDLFVIQDVIAMVEAGLRVTAQPTKLKVQM